MNFKLDVHHFEELIAKSYSLDHVFLLMLINEKYEVSPLCENSMKIAGLYQGLVRKGLITDDDKLTLSGHELLTFLATRGKAKKIIKRKPATTEFEDWWKAYPGTDTFTHKGKSFTGNRTLKSGRDECRLKFDKILLEGEYTAAQLIDALNFDVLQKKEASVKQMKNNLTYMQSSTTYLSKKSYEAIIELINEGVKIVESTEISKGTDI